MRFGVGTLVGLVVAVLPGSASGLTWGSRTPVDTTNSPATTAISCPSTSLCVVGGSHDHIATSTNPAGGAAAWSAAAVPGLAGTASLFPTIKAISCPTAQQCEAIDDAGNLLSTTNPAGGASTWTYTTLTGHSLGGLSCPTVNLCVATDYFHAAALIGGVGVPASSWATISFGFGAGAPGSVSCTATGTCVIAAGSVIWATKTPGVAASWKSAAIPPSGAFSSVDSVSCVPDFCVAGDDKGYIYSSTDPTGGVAKWSNFQSTSTVDFMSCAEGAPSLCVGAPSGGSFVLSSADPTGGVAAWAITQNVAGGGDPQVSDQIAGVSCPTTTDCFVATSKGYVVIGSTGSGGGGGGSTGGGGGGSTGGGGGGSTGGGGGSTGGGGGSTGGGRPLQVSLFRPSYGTNAVGFFLECSQYATGVLSGVTANIYSFSAADLAAVAAHKRHRHARRVHVSLGKVHFTLQPNRRKLVKLTYTKRIRTLLARYHRLKIKVSITLTNRAHQRTVQHRTITLVRKRPHKHG